MGDRNWEDLPLDCLHDIFSRLGLAFVVEDAPLVCKSWYQATLSPLCWTSLVFCSWPWGPAPERYTIEAFVKFVIRRSQGSATVVSLGSSSTVTPEVLKRIGERCPSLKRLVLPGAGISIDTMPMLSSMICKWKNLEALEIADCDTLKDIIPQISIHCKKFVSLSVVRGSVSDSEASAMATLLPNIVFLSFRDSWIYRSHLVIILKGCKKLVHLDVRFRFETFVVDDELMNLASHIPNFYFESAEPEEYDDYMYLESPDREYEDYLDYLHQLALDYDSIVE